MHARTAKVPMVSIGSIWAARHFERKRLYTLFSFFNFAKQVEQHFVLIFGHLQFREAIKTRQNMDLFRTVSYFAKLK